MIVTLLLDVAFRHCFMCTVFCLGYLHVNVSS